MPSGGDWALHRGGALFVEGAERFAALEKHGAACRAAGLRYNRKPAPAFTALQLPAPSS